MNDDDDGGDGKCFGAKWMAARIAIVCVCVSGYSMLSVQELVVCIDEQRNDFNGISK